MKTKNKLALGAIACIAFTACSNNEDFPQHDAEDALPICFHVGVDGLQSRAAHTSMSSVNDFGVAIKSNTVAYDYSNVQFTPDETHSTWTSTKKAFWDRSSHKVNILAYAPYDAAITPDLFAKTDKAVTVSAAPTADNTSDDLLICYKKDFDPATISSTSPGVDLEFKHALSQLTVELTFSSNFTATEISEMTGITLDGIILEGTCNFSKEKDFVSAKATPPADITPYKVTDLSQGQTLAYRCMVIPQQVNQGAMAINFKVGGSTYKWQSNEQYTFYENTSYNLKFNVNKISSASASLHRSVGNGIDNPTLTVSSIK